MRAYLPEHFASISLQPGVSKEYRSLCRIRNWLKSGIHPSSRFSYADWADGLSPDLLPRRIAPVTITSGQNNHVKSPHSNQD
jgi:hypothetical protein